MKHFISLKNFPAPKLMELVELTAKIKKTPALYKNKLKGKGIGLFFQKPSLRTKTSFYLGGMQLGAQVIYYAPSEVKIGEREAISDVAKTVSRYFDAVVFRTFSHKIIEELTEYATVPVINALSNLLHPSQVLGDLFTLYELKKDIKKIKLAYIGDGNNVCHSLLYAFSLLGAQIHIAAPAGYEPHHTIVSAAGELARAANAKITINSDLSQAAAGADVLYADVWTSMGVEKDKDKRREDFKSFQINDELLAQAKKDCVVMHCLPAHRGEEITADVIDGKNSVVFLQAENRLYSAKTILLYALGQGEP